jgi:leucyl-tRNA synthetase
MEISIYSTIDFSKSRNLLTERQKNIKAFNPIVPRGGCISLLELNPKQYSDIKWTLINEKTGKVTKTTAESSDAMHYVALPDGLRFGTYTLKIVTTRTVQAGILKETTISNPFEFVEASEDIITIVSRNLENDLVGNVPPNATIIQPIYVNSEVTYQRITIAVADWAGGTTCTKTVTGVTSTTWNSFAFAESYREKIIEFDVRPSGQGTGTITFTADSTPDAEIVLIVQIKPV